MTKLGSELQVGDVIKVWWSPNKAKVRKIHDMQSALSNEFWGGQPRCATLCAPNTRRGELEMTIEPNATFELTE